MKNVIIAMPMDKEMQKKIFDGLKKFPWLEETSMEFVHVFKQESYPYMLPPTIYPTPEQTNEIRRTIEEILEGVTQEVKALSKTSHCLFHESPKEGLVDYLEKKNPDLCIGFSKERHGLKGYFHSSFTEYLIKHSHVPVLILR